MHAITITLEKKSDKDNLLKILKAWEHGDIGIRKNNTDMWERYYSGEDYKNIKEPSDFSVTYFVEKETSNG